ncbi:hypothetical protein ILYODFUR_012241 [Ilyodon furcidens]|uniref:Uncharacterized protein n=1 Tax=Ilyodon furcidens TaxID=33524 RepID=A0ABV0TV29_9TELE
MEPIPAVDTSPPQTKNPCTLTHRLRVTYQPNMNIFGLFEETRKAIQRENIQTPHRNALGEPLTFSLGRQQHHCGIVGIMTENVINKYLTKTGVQSIPGSRILLENNIWLT